MEWLGYAIIFQFVINVLFYVSMGLCFYLGFLFWSVRQRLAILFLTIPMLPLLHYSVILTSAWGAQERRAAEIASWPRTPIWADQQITSIEVPLEADAETLGPLVASGIIKEIQREFRLYSSGTTITRTYSVSEREECIDFLSIHWPPTEFARAVLARFGFLRCLKENESPTPPSTDIEIARGKQIQHAYQGAACLSGHGYPLELYWSDKRGSNLIDFWEPPDLLPVSFPPVLAFRSGGIWSCPRLHSHNNKRYHFPDLFEFVTGAMGYISPDDFPKSPDATIPVRALKLLRSKLKSQEGNLRVLALLGQWRITPEISVELKSILSEKAGSRLAELALLTISRAAEDERTKELYPYLPAYRSIFETKAMGP